MAKRTSGRGQRDLKVKVKTARGRKLSSTRWLERQLNDPYVKRAKDEGLRPPRGVAPSDFRPLRKILDCSLP